MKWSVNSGLGYYFETILFIFLAFDFLSVLRGHSVFSSPPQRPMTSYFEEFLPQILPITCFPYFKFYWFFKTITKQVIQLILIMLVGTDVCVRMVFVWEDPEETQLSDLVTTWPSHMPTLGIEPWSLRWEASALTLRQPDSQGLFMHIHICLYRVHYQYNDLMKRMCIEE